MTNKTPTIKYFLYARKSSEAEDRQAASIEAQIDELKKIAKEQKLTIVEVLEESQSAKKPGRKVFNSMLERIYQGEANGILCWKLDRLARNPVDGGNISWAIQQGTIQQIVTFGRTYYPTDNVLMMQVELGMANQFIRDLSVNVKRGLAKKVRDGWLPSGAPIGYLNTRDKEKGYKTIKSDPERFQLVRRMWDLMLSGNYTAPQIWKISRKELNLTTVPRKRIGGKHLSKSAVYAIFENPFYYGWFEYPVRSGNWQKGAHEPMVTEEEFNRVQALMGNKNAVRSHGQTFAFTGLMKCGTCGCSITAEAKTKHCKNGNVHHYIYYHCTKKKVDVHCPEQCIEVKNLNLQIKEKLSDIKISEKFKDWAIKYLHEVRTTEAHSDRTVLISKHKELEEVTKSLQSLTLNFTSPSNQARGLISDEEYQSLKADMLKKKQSLEADLKVKGKQVEEWVELSERTFNFACYADIWFEKGDDNVRKAILSCLGSNLTLSGKKLNVSFYPFIKAFIESGKNVPVETDMVRTSKKRGFKRQNEPSLAHSSLGLRSLGSNQGPSR